MNSCGNITPLLNRRSLLQGIANGFGWLAFSGLASRSLAANASGPLAPKPTHFPARAKRVIFLCMTGGPSHVDTFDYKPKLTADSGNAGKRPGTKLLGSQWKFSQHGKSGLYLSELFPNVAKHADELCLLRSMQTNLPAHPQAFLNMHTGSSQFVRPSLGAWSLYGLGTANENLPGFVTISPSTSNGGAQNYGSSFLPAIYQGTRIGSNARSIANARVANLEPSVNQAAQRTELELLQSLNAQKLKKDTVNPEVEGVIQSYELAFKMQSEMPSVMDVEKETAATKKLYGLDNTRTSEFGRKCLLARRMVEKGVRFVEINHGNWDQHFNLGTALANNCGDIDLPISGLLTDLQQRGMLKDTLVIWGGEFGRTPHAQGGDGRDHNNKGFTMWMAGGGVKGGYSYGATDDYGYEAVDKPMPIHDWHATVLALLGLDHEQLTFPYAGRDFRLTDTKGTVAKEIFA
jgi:hypothetical protein